MKLSVLILVGPLFFSFVNQASNSPQYFFNDVSNTSFSNAGTPGFCRFFHFIGNGFCEIGIATIGYAHYYILILFHFVT